jgi:hypothetical protein
MNASEYPTTKFTTGASLRWMTIEIPFLVRTVMDSTLSLCLSLDKICAVRAGWLERAVQEMKERPRRKYSKIILKEKKLQKRRNQMKSRK